MTTVELHTRIRNPEKKLITSVQYFFDDPEVRGDKLVQLGRQEGYEFIRPACLGLLEISKDNRDREAFRVAALLTQPEWQYYRTSDEKIIAVVLSDDSEDIILGKYTQGKGEKGSVTILMDGLQDVTLLDPVNDPMDAFKSSNVKQKVWYNSRDKKFYVIEACRSREDMEKFYPTEAVFRIRVFCWKEKVAVIKQGPFDTKEQALAARTHILEG